MGPDRTFNRREFIEIVTRAGLGSAALTALPPWTRSALAAAAAAPPEIIVRNEWPEHWETALNVLGRSWLTRNDRFFVRSHFPVPNVDPKDWRLEVTGLVNTPLTLTLQEIKSMPPTDAVHTLECAGNGRGLFHLPVTSGTQWEYGAVGTASWRGVRLASLLERAGVKPEAKHVWFEAADAAPMPQVPKFLRSIPIEKAQSDTLLVHTMNDAPLPKLHGAPLRAIVPGWFGMASTKWVTRVRLEAAPSDNHFMVRGYRYTYPGGDPAKTDPVEGVKVKSVITRPLDGARVPPGRLRVQGLAWAGSQGVKLAEISSDGGKTWRPAGFLGEHQRTAWRMWATEIDVKATPNLTIMARATDNTGEIQPPDAKVNAGGYGNNSIHKVTVHVRA